MDDIFLKIIRGDIPAHKVYEDETTLAFLDIKPHNKGHVLVIPKTQYRNILDIPEVVLCDMIRTAKKVAPAVKDAVEADGINIGMNNEAAAGQEVFHAHLHIVPRFTNDNIYQGPRQLEYEAGEMEKVAEKIKKELH
jgi:histidine triad (HIT) family protein